jgi:hypothetical protein
MTNLEPVARRPASLPKVVATRLTIAAYPTAVRYWLGHVWSDLGIDVWKALNERLHHFTVACGGSGWPGNFAVQRECLLAELTDAAYRTFLRYGARGSFLELELGLYKVFCDIVHEISHEALLSHALHGGGRSE